MAYVDFRQHRGMPVGADIGADFAASEWAVIRMARRDPLASIARPSRLGYLVRALFGIEPPNRLADPRLEALRRVAVRCWRGDGSLERLDLEELISEGFAVEQALRLTAYVRLTRAQSAPPTQR
jgi:hypothetical protein